MDDISWELLIKPIQILEINLMDIEKIENYDEQLKRLEAAIEDAKENYGDTEIREAMMNKAEFFVLNGEQDKAIRAYLQAYEKTVGVSKRLEIYTILLQIYFKQNNLEEIKNYLAKSKKLLEEGGDWENKNKLKVATL
jgi:26S proteasome regulatory subunit N7